MTDECLADITSVPRSCRGRVLTSSAKLIENGLFLLQFLLFGACTLAPAILGGLAATGKLFPGNQASFLPALIGLAASAGLGWVLAGAMFRKPWSSSYLFQKAKSELGQRPDALVDANHPEAIFVEVIPRSNWGQLSLQNAEDVGFLHIDLEQRRLLIEGDQKRYRIPAQTLVSCDVELMNPNAANNAEAIPVGLVVLTVRDSLGNRELPLRPVRTAAGDPLGGNYVARAQELQRRIGNLGALPAEDEVRATA